MQAVLFIGMTIASLWLLVVLIQTILYGSLTCATGVSGLYIASCVKSPTLFTIGDMPIDTTGIVAFLLFIAMFKFGARFVFELKIAYGKIMHPFTG